MLLLSILASVALPDLQPVSLARTFAKGDRAAFLVSSTLKTETKERGLGTWFPDRSDISYRFTFDVLDVGAQGIAKVRYVRPAVTRVFAEQFDRPERTVVQKVNDDVMMQISPANEILEVHDIVKLHAPLIAEGARMAQQTMTSFLESFYNLALFTGSLESSIEFNPRLPFDKVKPGESWKRTASYAPQKVGESAVAVRRLDYTYVYVGRIHVGPRDVDRVTAKLKLDTDMAAYLHETAHLTPAETRLASLPVELEAEMSFDLDKVSHRTLAASARSKGSLRVFTIDSPTEAAHEERIEGETTMEPVASPSSYTKPKTAGKKG